MGLILTYLFNFWLTYWTGPFLYLLPWYQKRFDVRLVEMGVEQSTYAMVAFALGSLALAPSLRDLLPAAVGIHKADANVPKAYMGIGMVCFLLMSSIQGIPTATAIISCGQQLLIIGLGLSCWQALRQKEFNKLALWLGLTALLPFLTVVTRGFLGVGAVAAFTVAVFISSFLRSRVTLVLAGILVGYFGLSIFVTYMRDRIEIRELVWTGRPLADRMERISLTVDTFEWFNPFNEEHLERIDSRLNQSHLVGAAVNHLSDGDNYAHGATLWQALLAMIPRAIWPEKPTAAGSGTLVTEYTGIAFQGDTSVGIGQVMEFYVNFGTLGVVIGFIVMGATVTILDLMAAEHLARGDLQRFVLWYLPGLSLLQVGGSMVEITSSAAASVFAAMVANKYLDRLQRKKSAKVEAALPPAGLEQNS